eukprot:scaffold263010_cov43-Prasinocladus_malaysianus.AAC.2
MKGMAEDRERLKKSPEDRDLEKPGWLDMKRHDKGRNYNGQIRFMGQNAQDLPTRQKNAVVLMASLSEAVQRVRTSGAINCNSDGAYHTVTNMQTSKAMKRSAP